MIVYRVSRLKYAQDLSGEGARLFGGRWNNKLVSCVYTSESRALAVLEYTVNINLDDIPRALCIATIEIPDEPVIKLTEAELPGDWKQSPAPFSTKEFGSQLLTKGAYLTIKIPSAVIPHEFNYLINPLHPDRQKCKVLSTEDFAFDVRIKTT